jgi:hypothetical protein
MNIETPEIIRIRIGLRPDFPFFIRIFAFHPMLAGPGYRVKTFSMVQTLSPPNTLEPKYYLRVHVRKTIQI